MLKRIKAYSRKLKKELGALYIAFKRNDVPWYAKAVLAIVLGYALSPIDLIPDFIPILGYVDDLILIPLGIALVIYLIPPDIMETCRRQAEAAHAMDKSSHWLAGTVIIGIWILIIVIITMQVI
jgi:uncharacterized membrane protein YkvA (DUF1232 family)